MIALPVCRWREQHIQDLYVCRSTKYANTPNLVGGQFCAECCYADHEPAPPLPRGLPCVHQGAFLEKEVQARVNGYSQEVFACALHGRCTNDVTEQGSSSEQRSCACCSDYLARDPFGPNSIQMLGKAEAFLEAIPEYPTGRYQGRGVVIAGGGDRFFPSLYVTIRALRHLGCRLPIQVWYLGRHNEMPAQKQALLAPYQVECVDGDAVRRRHPARRLDGWELKVFATLHCPFEELLFLDADSYPCRNPEFLFELEDYRERGAIFWPDVTASDPRLEWSAFGVPGPRRPGSVESGQLVLNKRQSWRPLNLAWFYNDHSDYYYSYGHGDKHTFEVAWARCAQPYVMWESKGQVAEVAYLHRGPDQQPLFVHRCCDKFRLASHEYYTKQSQPLPSFHSALPLERECWKWLTELARLTGHTLTHEEIRQLVQPSCRSRPNQSHITLASSYTPDNAALGERVAKLLTAYGKQHGYEAIVATDRLDASRPAAWSKLLLIERYLTENPACAWVMWIDAEAIVANPTKRLEDLLDDNVDFLVAADLAPNHINTEAFLVRNCPAALHMLRCAYDKVQYVHHPLHEQPAVAEALCQCIDTIRTRIISKSTLNPFSGYTKTPALGIVPPDKPTPEGFAVGIVTYTQYPAVEKCLESIWTSSVKPSKIVIIDNGGRYVPKCPDKVDVVRPVRNLGVATAWNMIHVLTEPMPVVIINDDIVFGNTALEKLLEAPGDIVVAKDCPWACFKQAHHLWRTVGYYDEIFYPAYMEDSDYQQRLKHAGVTINYLPVDINHVSGGTRFNLSPPDRQDLEWYYAQNKDYYHKKWGGPLGHESFKVPFNDPDYYKEPTALSFLHSQFARACMTATDICEHLPILREYAMACDHVTEMGVREGQSTLAFLLAQPKKLVCYDVDQCSKFTCDRLRTMQGRSELIFIQGDVLKLRIAETDLLFIDTIHTFVQLTMELKLHSNNTRKYIIVHDTTTFGARGEDGNEKGLWNAVEEFLEEHKSTWKLLERRENNNGLTVLERLRAKNGKTKRGKTKTMF